MKSLFGGLVLGATLLGAGGDALACGGCFIPPQPPGVDSVVTGHRMAFALAPDRTVLWDQIQYSGDPTEFGWVLPVQHGAYVEQSTDAWFESLDAVSTVTVTAPPLVCATPQGGGIGCGSFSAKGAEDLAARIDENRVQVLHEGTVGPYETVTLSSKDGSALRSWLQGHGYIVPPEIDPVIDAYVSEGADFIALRLLPGKGVSSMTPVRVITPGGPSMLPLRMVAAGTGDYVDIVLYVIGEGRYLLSDLTETKVDLSKLTYDLSKSQSNYLTLRGGALAENDGDSFLTAFATPSPFASDPSASYTVSRTGGGYASLQDLYFAQAASNDGDAGVPGCGSMDFASSVLVGDGTGGTLAATGFTCGGHSDVSVALTGLHPSKVWVTRLEMNLPHEALSADCHVALSKTQSPVSKDLKATKITGRTSSCPEPVFQSGLAPPAGSPAATCAWGIASLAALGLLRRRRVRAR